MLRQSYTKLRESAKKTAQNSSGQDADSVQQYERKNAEQSEAQAAGYHHFRKI